MSELTLTARPVGLKGRPTGRLLGARGFALESGRPADGPLGALAAPPLETCCCATFGRVASIG
jgi:hypothetical protein